MKLVYRLTGRYKDVNHEIPDGDVLRGFLASPFWPRSAEPTAIDLRRGLHLYIGTWQYQGGLGSGVTPGELERVFGQLRTLLHQVDEAGQMAEVSR